MILAYYDGYGIYLTQKDVIMFHRDIFQYFFRFPFKLKQQDKNKKRKILKNKEQVS